jgi:transposase-like protein
MTEDRLPLAELLQKAGEGDFLRSVAEAVLQLLMEADAEGLIGAGPARALAGAAELPQRLPRAHARHPARLAPAPRPKLRQGSYFPPFLEPRKVSERRWWP